ncbi:MAG: hypothetical protein ACRDZZ_10075 [Ilumatobacteraceae bacterium]
MKPHVKRHLRRLVELFLCSAIAAVPLVGGDTVSAKGGWAVSTLDEVPSPTPGATVTVGFTIRQHGVTPVNVEDVAVEITAPSGAVELFPARQQGPTGHYVADVVFGEVGVHSWSIKQGWFADQELGVIDTSANSAAASSGAGSTGGDGSSSTRFLRFGMPTVALALAGYAAADAIRSRRRRHAVAA